MTSAVFSLQSFAMRLCQSVRQRFQTYSPEILIAHAQLIVLRTACAAPSGKDSGPAKDIAEVCRKQSKGKIIELLVLASFLELLIMTLCLVREYNLLTIR